jgi:hypothetical protein
VWGAPLARACRPAPPTTPLPPRHPDFPRAPNPVISALFAPFAWTYGRPDLFDSYSIGILLMQMVWGGGWGLGVEWVGSGVECLPRANGAPGVSRQGAHHAAPPAPRCACRARRRPCRSCAPAPTCASLTASCWRWTTTWRWGGVPVLEEKGATKRRQGTH